LNKKHYFPLLLFIFLGINTAFAQRTITGTVTSSADKQPLPEAVVLLKGSNIGVVADDNGKYTINVPSATGTLVFTYIGFQSKEVVIAADVIDIALSEGEELNNVLVIGTRNASRTKIESPVPVDIIPIRAIVNEVGQVEINQILHYAAPSFQSNRQTIADGTDHIDPASLRGLGPDQVLVLINGKRRHTSALVNVNGTVGRGTVGTDLAAIPAHSIERIEILRDGASAQYGSDAIAGVINIVLKRDVNHLSAVVTGGIHKAQDGAMQQGSLNYGVKIGQKGFLNLTGEYTQRGYTNRMKSFTGPIFWNPTAPTTNPAQNKVPYTQEWRYQNLAFTAHNGKTAAQLDDSTLAAKGMSRSDFNMRVGNSAIQSYGGVLNFSYPFNDKLEVYAFATANQKMGVAAGFYRAPKDGRNIEVIYENGFLPEIHTNIKDLAGAVGIKGTINNWKYDLSNTYGTSILGYKVKNSLNTSMGINSPKEFDCGNLTFAQNTTNLDFSKNAPDLFQGTNFALGAELRSDIYQQAHGEEASYLNANVGSATKAAGAQVFPGFRPKNDVNNTRTNMSIYADMEADFTDRFMMGIALRYENYSDFGATQNYKLVGKYKFSKNFMLRGSASTGFRAPSQQQKFFNTTSTLFDGSTPYEVATLRNDSEAARLLGIPRLRQESSLNYSAGFAFKPNENFELTVDGYLIDITDRIILTGQFEAVLASGSRNDTLIAAALKAEEATKAAFFTNAVDTRTMGLDLVASYQWLLANKHSLRFILAANYNKNEVTSAVKSSPELTGRENTYFNREDRSRLEVVNPNAKVTFSINWKHKKMWAMLRNVYFGEVKYIDPSVVLNTNKQPLLDANGDVIPTKYIDINSGETRTLDQTFAPRLVTDLTIGYQINKFLNVSLGANNLLDVYPDQQTHSENQSYGRFLYSRRVSQFGFNGAFYFARMRFDLK
jgi:iron complex outermembrane recepter protein